MCLDSLVQIKDPDHEVSDLLIGFDLHHVIHALSELGISPSIDFFAKLVSKKLAGNSVEGIETLVRGLLREEPQNLSVPTELPGEQPPRNPLLLSILSPFSKQASIFPHDVFGRSIAQTNNIGGFGNGPKLEEDPLEAARKADEEARAVYRNIRDNADSNILKTLFMVGGAAVAAKWLLTKMIEEKMNLHRTGDNSRTKIVLVKSAEEAILTNNIAKAVLLRDLKGWIFSNVH